MISSGRRLAGIALPPEFRLTIIRHAQTPASLDGTFCGARDVALTSVGRRMAELLPGNPLLAGIERVIASPMERTRDTARPVTSAFDLADAKTDPRLRELEFGAWEGLAPSALRDRADHASWQADPYANAPPGGETGAEVLERALRAVADALATTVDLAIVTHKSPARLLAAYFGAASPESFRSLAGFWVSSVTRIEVCADLATRVLGPSVEHLPPSWQSRPDRHTLD